MCACVRASGVREERRRKQGAGGGAEGRKERKASGHSETNISLLILVCMVVMVGVRGWVVVEEG